MSQSLPYPDSDNGNAQVSIQSIAGIDTSIPDEHEVTIPAKQTARKVSQGIPFEIAEGSKVAELMQRVERPKVEVSQEVSQSEKRDERAVTLEVSINKPSEEEDLEEVKAFASAVDYSVPTQALLNLRRKYDAIKNQKSRAVNNSRLNVFEKEALAAGYSRKMAFLTAEMNKIKNKTDL